jgi:hypothetical protein
MRYTGIVVGAIAALLLTACGDEDDGGNSGDGGGGAIAIIEGKGGGDALFAAMTAAQADAETTTYQMDMTVAASSVDVTIDANGQMRISSDTTADLTMAMSMSIPPAGDIDIAMNMLDGILYTDMFEAMGQPMPTKWVAIDTTADDPVGQLFAEAMGDQQAMADTSAMLAENSDLVEVEEGERGEVDGVDATEYLMTVDVEDLMEMGALSEGQLGMSASEFPMDTLTYSFWLSDDDLPLKISFDMEFEEAGETVDLTMDMRFTDWGEPVTIEAPPESEVTDINDAMADMMGKEELTEDDLAQLEQMFG